MGRPPCCDKEGVKKGPWTPEEDIILVSYIQEHGPGNWRAVPTNTGLLRCSKSCRLRWTNYLRPGIKRGNFTEQEEKMIIHLQALLGNRWAAIASYLPQRTDNDIKNYWNTHLRKKLKKLDVGSSKGHFEDGSSSSPHSMSRGQWERRLQTNIHMAKRALSEALSAQTNSSLSDQLNPPDVSLFASSRSLQTSSTYAASADNIARLLKGWMGNSSNPARANSSATTQNSFNNMASGIDTASSDQGTPSAANGGEFGLSDNFESLFESLDSSTSEFSQSLSPEPSPFQDESKPNDRDHEMHLSFIEKWLFDDSICQEKISYGSDTLVAGVADVF